MNLMSSTFSANFREVHKLWHKSVLHKRLFNSVVACVGNICIIIVYEIGVFAVFTEIC